MVYENEWFRVREDRVIRPDGADGIYGTVEMAAAVGVVALDESWQVQLVGQWRYPLGRFSWEVPSGSCEGTEEPLEAGRRELEEEAGLRARTWRQLGTLDTCNAVTTEVVHLFLATGLEVVGSRPDPMEELVAKKVPLRECVAMVMDGRITDATSVAAILKAARVVV